MLTIGGLGRVIKVNSFRDAGVEKPDQDHVEATAEVQLQVSVNVGMENVQVKDACEWWCMAGGLVDRRWQGNTNFYGLGPNIGPGIHWSNPWNQSEMQHPVEHVVLMAKVQGSASPLTPPERWVAGQFGVGADAATVWDGSVESAPEVLAATVPPLPIFVPPRMSPQGLQLAHEAALVPVFIAVETPANVVDLILPDDGLRVQRTLYVQGQIVNWFKDIAVLNALNWPAAHPGTQFQVKVTDAAGGVTVLDELLFDGRKWLLTSGPEGARGFTFDFDHRVASFILSRPVPRSFTLGHLEFLLTVNNHTYKRKVPVQFAAVDVLHWPLGMTNDPNRLLLFINGPGVNVFHSHNQDVRQRYALDVSVATPDYGTRPTGSPDQMGSYFASGMPVLCVADGVVRAVFDDSADNTTVHQPGDVRGTDRVNRVYVEHEREGGRRYSVYAHIKKDSAKGAGIAVGGRVTGGQKIAEVGWNGGSDEPHIHLAYYTLDSFGRYQALPMAFSLRSQPHGPAVIGVPMDGILALRGPLPDEIVSSLTLSVRIAGQSALREDIGVSVGTRHWSFAGPFNPGQTAALPLDPGRRLFSSMLTTIRIEVGAAIIPSLPWEWVIGGVRLEMNGRVVYRNDSINARLSPVHPYWSVPLDIGGME